MRAKLEKWNQLECHTPCQVESTLHGSECSLFNLKADKSSFPVDYSHVHHHPFVQELKGREIKMYDA